MEKNKIIQELGFKNLNMEINVIIPVRSKIFLINTMNLIILLIILVAFVSCREGKSDLNNTTSGYSIDTVLINSKGYLLDMNGLMASDLDHGDSVFYMFNMFDHSVNEINLNKKEYVKNFPLEKEGANGIGEFVFGLQYLNDSLFFVKSNFISSIVSKNGNVINKLAWEEAKTSNGEVLELLPRYNEYISLTNENKYFSLSLDFSNQKAFLDVMDSNNDLIRHDVDPESSFNDFFFKFDDKVNFLNPTVFFRVNKNYICVSHEYSNEIILYNHNGDFVKVIQYEPKLTPKRAIISQSPVYKPREQIKNEFQQILEQVRFEPPVFDKKNNRYLRLSAKRIFTETYEHERSFIPITKDTRVFLSIFDHEFNLISETEIVELKNERMRYFTKDGKLWVANNYSDNLGFIVIDI